MIADEVKALPVQEKIRIMEATWEDFRDRFDRMEIPQEQKELLDQRRARVREGKARLLDWDSVKGTIGKQWKDIEISDDVLEDLNSGYLFYEAH